MTEPRNDQEKRRHRNEQNAIALIIVFALYCLARIAGVL